MPGDKLVLVCPEGFGFGLRCPNLCESSNDKAAVQHSTSAHGSERFLMGSSGDLNQEVRGRGKFLGPSCAQAEVYHWRGMTITAPNKWRLYTF